MSLVLTRKPGESIKIGEEIVVTVNRVKGNQVVIAIEAPKELAVHRDEIYEHIQKEAAAK